MMGLTFEMGGEEENSLKFLAASFGSNPSFFIVETIIASIMCRIQLLHFNIVYERTILFYTQASRLFVI